MFTWIYIFRHWHCSAQLHLVYRSRTKSLYQSSITVCPANATIYSTQTKTCELILCLYTSDSQNLCRRRLLLHHKTPNLQRYESTWIYYLPERQHVVLRCWKDKAWTSSTHILYGNGVIYSTSQYLLTAGKFQTLPDIMGNTRRLSTPQNYMCRTKLPSARTTNCKHTRRRYLQRVSSLTTSDLG